MSIKHALFHISSGDEIQSNLNLSEIGVDSNWSENCLRSFRHLKWDPKKLWKFSKAISSFEIDLKKFKIIFEPTSISGAHWNVMTFWIFN